MFPPEENRSCKLKEYIPIKQGLRLFVFEALGLRSRVLKEYIPIKQGLRHIHLCLELLNSQAQRVYSNKTRIKTPLISWHNVFRAHRSKSIFQ